MIDLIPSKDVREHIMNTKRSFTDFEQAVIIYNSSLFVYDIQIELKKLAERTSDENLKQQIFERIKYDTTCINTFEQKCQGYVYAVVTYQDYEPDICGYFVNAALAHAHGLKQGVEFDIKKYQIVGFENSEPIVPRWLQNPYLSPEEKETSNIMEMEYSGDAVANFSYDMNGRLIDFNSDERSCTDEELLKLIFDPTRFENAYINIPNPFEKGDRVRCITNGEEGVVVTSQEEWKDFNQKALNKPCWDFFDVCINVEFMEGKEKYVDHICYLYLERCD